MLTAPAGEATQIGTVASATSADATVDADGHARDPSIEPCLQSPDDRARISAHALDAAELELEDEDTRPETSAIATAVAPALEPSRISAIPDRASAATGRPQVAAALARGPPTLR